MKNRNKGEYISQEFEVLPNDPQALYDKLAAARGGKFRGCEVSGNPEYPGEIYLKKGEVTMRICGPELYYDEAMGATQDDEFYGLPTDAGYALQDLLKHANRDPVYTDGKTNWVNLFQTVNGVTNMVKCVVEDWELILNPRKKKVESSVVGSWRVALKTL